MSKFAEASAGAADGSDAEVDRFGRAVRCVAAAVVGEDLGLPGADGLGQSGEFGDLGVGAVSVEGGESAPCGALTGGAVHVSKELLGDESGPDLVLGVAGGQAGLDAGPAPLREPLGPHEQQPADPLEGVSGPASLS